MHTGALKKMALALTFWLALHTASLKAQILGPYGTSPTTFEVDANGLLSDTGTFGTGTLSLSGAGTRMFWYPGKAAFRAGYVSGTDWNDSNIGAYSVAFGENTTASGSNSVAMGGYNTASAYGSVALGANATASGDGALAVGLVFASGSDSVAIGVYTTASGNCSVAMGEGELASGNYSVAMGDGNSASANDAFAAGIVTTANAFDAFVVGTLNAGLSETGATPSLTTWNATPNQADPLFEIGDGTRLAVSPYTITKADALVVYKDGSAKFQGPVTVPQSGDIPMYTGN
jgi:hypothetical protein